MPSPIKEVEKIKILSQIALIFTKSGFENISMDEVAKQTKISKATLYKYYKSKEDIVRFIMEEPIQHLNSIQLNPSNSIEEVLKTISAGFSKAILTTTFANSIFLKDLSFRFPHIYAEYKDTVIGFCNRFIEFYENVYAFGYFREININLVMEQIKGILPIILNVNYIIEQQTTITIMIRDYYKIILCQLLCNQYLEVVDETSTYVFVDELTNLIKTKFLVNESL